MPELPAEPRKGRQIEVVTVRALWSPRPLRHPVTWWKTRHIRKAMRRPLAPIEAAVSAEVERTFLFGVDHPEVDGAG